MVVGYVFFVMGWFGVMYIGILLMGFCYGVYWVIMLVIVFELFGLKKFGVFYNFFNLVNFVGMFVFLGVIVSSIYDCEVEK